MKLRVADETALRKLALRAGASLPLPDAKREAAPAPAPKQDEDVALLIRTVAALTETVRALEKRLDEVAGREQKAPEVKVEVAAPKVTVEAPAAPEVPPMPLEWEAVRDPRTGLISGFRAAQQYEHPMEKMLKGQH